MTAGHGLATQFSDAGQHVEQSRIDAARSEAFELLLHHNDALPQLSHD
jgi:hypothetical protein